MPHLQTLLTSFLLALGLAACGGGGGSTSTPLNVSAGLYNNTANGDEIVTLLVNNSSVPSQTPNWFGIKFTNGNNNPDLYSAFITGFGGSTLSGTATKHFQGVSSPRTGNASLTMPLETKLASNLSFVATSQENASSLSWQTDQLNIGQYNYNSTASSLSGTWTGKWYFGLNTSNDKSLVLNQGQVTGSQSVITNCNLENTQLTAISGVNVYSVTLYITTNTNCTLSSSNTGPTLYKGLAFVTNNPVAGKTSRLQIMATGTDGKAVFFRGDF